MSDDATTKSLFKGEFLSVCCGAKPAGSLNDKDEGECSQCHERDVFIQYFKAEDFGVESTGATTAQPNVRLLFDCIERLQDIFNACQQVRMSQESQITLFYDLQIALQKILSACLKHVPPKKGSGSPPASEDPSSSNEPPTLH